MEQTSGKKNKNKNRRGKSASATQQPVVALPDGDTCTEDRNAQRARYARHLDYFGEGEVLFKVVEPYGYDRALFNSAVTLIKKNYSSIGELVQADVRYSDDRHDSLFPVHFYGWLNSQLLCDSLSSPVGPIAEHQSLSLTTEIPRPDSIYFMATGHVF